MATRIGYTLWRGSVYPAYLPAPRAIACRAVRMGAGWLLIADADIDPPYYCYWFVDGRYVERTYGPRWYLGRRSAVHVQVLVSRHNDLDETRWYLREPGRRIKLEWIRPASGEVDEYGVEYVTGTTGGTWAEFARVPDTGGWSYQIESPPLDDLTYYRFRVVPYRFGNAGTALEWSPRYICRRPDTPGYLATLVAGRINVASA